MDRAEFSYVDMLCCWTDWWTYSMRSCKTSRRATTRWNQHHNS